MFGGAIRGDARSTCRGSVSHEAGQFYLLYQGLDTGINVIEPRKSLTGVLELWITHEATRGVRDNNAPLVARDHAR